MPSDQVTEAVVKLHGETVGFMRYARGTTTFRLDDEKFTQPRRPTLGQLFEEQPSRLWKQAQRVPVWFSNLLPEGRLRETMAQSHGVSPQNEFRLLLAVGADLPGAVSVERLDDEAFCGTGLDDEPANAADDEPDAAPTGSASHAEPVALGFSVAGVQLKLSMLMSAGGIAIPGPGVLGDRLVKFPSHQYPHVPENEFAMMTWAREAGIDTPPGRLALGSSLGALPQGFEVLDDTHVFVVERFDRAGYRHRLFEPDGIAADRAVHIEDLNQVLGNWPDTDAKYRGSFERIGRLIAGLCGHDDFLEFVRRLTFCIAVGNEDAHHKNWSLWYPDRITPRLAPAYDLISTIQFPGLSRDTGLRIGRGRSASTVDLTVMEGLAAGTAAGAAEVRATVEDTLSRIRAAWTEIGDDLPINRSFREALVDYQRSVPLLGPLRS